MPPTVTKYSFIEPKQVRSKRRFDKVLEAAEFIYQNKNYELTIQDISRLTGMKRPSIYKFFPSNEALIEALSYKYATNLTNLIQKNLDGLHYEDSKELIKVVIDIYAIFMNKNYPFSLLLFNQFSRNLMLKNLINLLEEKPSNNVTKMKFTLSILMSCLGDFFNDEGNVTPKCVVETKKACLHYLSN
jgi:AcrR family transcriptional regulator|tara:strand:+ start:386 stop:946 length:561 start_codon:yes stop_codon:yes gene_type:complete